MLTDVLVDSPDEAPGTPRTATLVLAEPSTPIARTLSPSTLLSTLAALTAVNPSESTPMADPSLLELLSKLRHPHCTLSYRFADFEPLPVYAQAAHTVLSTFPPVLSRLSAL